MNIPKEALVKAIEGEWQVDDRLEAFEVRFRDGDPTGCELSVRPKSGFQSYYVTRRYAEIALMNSFWQALGRALKWEDGKGKNHDPRWTVQYNIDEQEITAKWLNWQMEFNYFVMTGSDTREFWKQILK